MLSSMEASRKGGANGFKVWISRPEGMVAINGPIGGMAWVLIYQISMTWSCEAKRPYGVIHLPPFLLQHLQYPLFLRPPRISAPMGPLLDPSVFPLLFPSLLQSTETQSLLFTLLCTLESQLIHPSSQPRNPLSRLSSQLSIDAKEPTSLSSSSSSQIIHISQQTTIDPSHSLSSTSTQQARGVGSMFRSR